MRKFKLIKEYPGSPKLNTEVETDGNKILYKGVHSTLLIKEVTNFSEFWQEVIEKDYEILMYKHSDGQVAGIEYINACLKLAALHEGWKIYSVKRLSDGEIFTIGDKVNTSNCCNVRIKQFNIDNNNTIIICHEQGDTFLIFLKTLKKPLFTTEDGVDIFKNDICWVVGPHNYSLFKWTNPTNTVIIADEKYFSTKEAAKDYILMNKPCLSINDLMKAASITYCNLTGLKELVKSKL